MSCTVGIVEDEDSIALALRVLMEREGRRVTRWRDGAEAADALCAPDAPPPALLLLDVNLPGLSGYAVCERLRAQTRLDGSAILMLSAGAARHAEERALAAGADGFMPKPFDAAELVATCARLLSARGQAGTPGHG